MELEFPKFELHDKLEFHKLKFQKSSRFLIILQTVVDRQIFFPKKLFGLKNL